MTTLPTSAFRYVECDIPEGMTVRDWRRATAPAPSRTLRGRLFARHGRHRAPTS